MSDRSSDNPKAAPVDRPGGGAAEPARPNEGGGEAAVIAINDLRPGEIGRVIAIEATSADMNRLKAMGVCVGRKVEAIQVGNPLILRVLGVRLGVSARLARQVSVTICGCERAAAEQARGSGEDAAAAREGEPTP